MHHTLCLKLHTFRDLKRLAMGCLALLFEIELISLWLHWEESGASRLMPRWTLALFSCLLSDAAILAFILLCDPFAICWKSLLLLNAFSCISINMLFYLFLSYLLLYWWILSRVRECRSSSKNNNLRLRDVLWSDDIEEFIHENLVLFEVDVEAEVYRRKNLKLAINQGILVNSEGGCIVDVILEAIPIFVDKESFFIVFVCEKKASAIESIKVKVGWRYLLNTVARIQYENFLLMLHWVLDWNITMDIDVGHDYTFFWASKKRCGAYDVIMEQPHPLLNLLMPSLKIKQLAVKHWYNINFSWYTYCEVHIKSH